MGNYEYSTVIGSGTVPNIGHGPAHDFPDGTYPIPSQRESTRTRRGDGVVVINPEDFSVSIGLRQQAITVGITATPLPTIPLEFRRALVIHNVGSATIYIGDSSVTTANGLPISGGEKIAFDITGSINTSIYAVASSPVEVRILELA